MTNNTPFLLAGGCILALMFIMAVFAKLYRKAGPHEALIVYGFGGTRVIKGRGTVIYPMVQSCRGLSLELMSFDRREPSDAGDSAPPGFGAQFTEITPEARQLVYRYVRNREPLFHDDL